MPISYENYIANSFEHSSADESQKVFKIYLKLSDFMNCQMCDGLREKMSLTVDLFRFVAENVTGVNNQVAAEEKINWMSHYAKYHSINENEYVSVSIYASLYSNYVASIESLPSMAKGQHLKSIEGVNEDEMCKMYDELNNKFIKNLFHYSLKLGRQFKLQQLLRSKNHE